MCIGPARAADSYLQVETIVQAALGVGARGHSSRLRLPLGAPALARLCEQHGLVFIGPTAAQIEAVGDKLQARAAAEAAGVPVVPGAAVTGVPQACELARGIGVPLLVKAVGGGGGRGMKLVRRTRRLCRPRSSSPRPKRRRRVR